MLMADGPLLGMSFEHRYKGVEYDLPEHLNTVINEEYERWLMTAGKSAKEKSSVKFSCQPDASSSLDSIAKGSLSVRFGAEVALPFYARFRNEAEAAEYCKKKLEPFNLPGRGKTLCIIWDSSTGQDLISTLVLSKKALSFLVARDLSTVESSPALTNKPIVWASWSSFSTFLTYFVHQKFFNKTAVSFAAAYTVLLALTIVGSREWHRSYRYLNDCHADSSAARLSPEHCEGGREFYVKFLRRNRILRSLMDPDDAMKTFEDVGNVKSAVTSYLLRYDLVKDVMVEDEQLRPMLQGDD